jgi:uncharacterized membrane protein
MPPVLIIHIAAGSLAILSGAAAIAVRKGDHLHRVFGTVFFASMLTTATLAVYLALFVPPVSAGGAPAGATVPVAILSFYLAATAWMAVRRREARVGLFEYGALLAALTVAAALLIYGVRAQSVPAERLQGFPVRYYVFASFAAFAAAMDLKVITRRGIAGRPRITRHLWRMCFALFFACAFFFLGQRRVVAFMHHSPLLMVPALAPLVLMIFWLVRVRLTNGFKPRIMAPS